MQDVMPLRIHRGNMFVSGEAWRLFQEAHPGQDFSDFWLEVLLKFSIDCFDLSSFLLSSQRRELRCCELKLFEDPGDGAH
jgi:hypothetical protein